MVKLFHLAIGGVALSAVLACTPLPDIDEDQHPVRTLSPIPLDQIDAAVCDADGAPESLCSKLGK